MKFKPALTKLPSAEQTISEYDAIASHAAESTPALPFLCVPTKAFHLTFHEFGDASHPRRKFKAVPRAYNLGFIIYDEKGNRVGEAWNSEAQNLIKNEIWILEK